MWPGVLMHTVANALSFTLLSHGFVTLGGALTALRAWRGSLIVPFAAHLTLNLVEFTYVWLAMR